MISVQTDQVWGPRPSERVFELASRALRDYCPDEQAARLSLLNISENATFRVEWTDNQPDTVLRLHRTGYTTPLEIDSELAWIRALREESGIQTPHVILTRDGRSRGQVIHQSSGDVHAFVMFEMCPGVEPSTDDMATWMVHLGEINAIMHRHVRQWRPPAGFTRRTWDTNTMFGDKPLWGRWQNGGNMSPQQLALLSRTTAAMAEKLDTFGKAADRFGLIHADLRLANLLIDDGDTYVIDFDDCGFGWYLYDAATALTFLQAEPQAPAWLQAWAAGYERHLVLDNDDRAILPTLIMARRMMELAWMGSHAHTETARQEGNAYVDGTCEIAIPKRCDELALGEGSPQFMRQHGPVTRRRKHRHAVQSLHPMRAIRYVSAVATQDTVIQLRAAIRAGAVGGRPPIRQLRARYARG